MQVWRGGIGTKRSTELRRHFAGMRGTRNHYRTLGVAEDASQGEIKRAYFQQAKKYHPDVNQEPGAAAKFRDIAKAYQVLGNPQRRAAYDRTGDVPDEEFRPPPPGSAPDLDPQDIFDSVMEDLGVEDFVAYCERVQKDLAEAAEKASRGEFEKAREFAWEHKGLFAVVLSVVLLLRHPALVAVVLRGAASIAALSLRDASLRQAIGRWTWFRWQQVVQRAAAKKAAKKAKKGQ